MIFKDLYDFLDRLQHNNNKAWMDAHRKEYRALRDGYVQWLDKMNGMLADIDPDYYDTPGKKAINRINNNLMFHPDRPVYKDHFGAGLDQKSKKGDFYIQLGIGESLVYSGYYKPDKAMLNSIREAIDYNGDELLRLMNAAPFKATFGGLAEDEDKLSSSPKGYAHDHPHIELLKHKNFGIKYVFAQEEVLRDDFEQRIIHLYKLMLPFRRYFDQAVSV